jgi:hypothetical protein
MTHNEAREFLDLLLGYWPRPELTDVEARVWREVLTKNLSGSKTDITRDEAHGWINRLLDREWRPIAGHLESTVRNNRRAFNQLDELPDGVPMPEDFKQIVTRCDA